MPTVEETQVISKKTGTPSAGRKRIPVNVHFEPEVLEAIEDYRFSNRFPTRLDAIRALLQSGLKQSK